MKQMLPWVIGYMVMFSVLELEMRTLYSKVTYAMTRWEDQGWGKVLQCGRVRSFLSNRMYITVLSVDHLLNTDQYVLYLHKPPYLTPSKEAKRACHKCDVPWEMEARQHIGTIGCKLCIKVPQRHLPAICQNEPSKHALTGRLKIAADEWENLRKASSDGGGERIWDLGPKRS